MQYVKNIFFSYQQDGSAAEDDELDELFGQLEQFKPPESIVQSILDAVAQLPPYSTQNWDEYEEDLIVRHDHLPPS